MPGVSPAAMQMWRFVARILQREVKFDMMKLEARPEFEYWETRGRWRRIGRSRAVAIRWDRSSFPACWRGWRGLFIHLIFLVGFRNRAWPCCCGDRFVFHLRSGAAPGIITYPPALPRKRPNETELGLPGEDHHHEGRFIFQIAADHRIPRAWWISSWSVSSPGPRDLWLWKVRAISVNPVDTKVRGGEAGWAARREKDAGLGCRRGVVTEIGAGVTLLPRRD